MGLFQRYRDFLLSKETICAAINGILLLAGFCVSLAGLSVAGRRLYFASAVLGGVPLFMLTVKALFVRRDITAGFMATTAVIAAIIIGEYSAAALVVFMFAIGDWLENLTIARANNALSELAKLAPPTVTVRRNGRETIISVEEAVMGDIVLVRSGERIGVDGVVISGVGSVNQAAITGESMPVEKGAGDDAYAGTLNEVGAFELKVTRLGADTTLGHIVKLVKDAQASQAPVQRIANKYAVVLVPITFSIAGIVYLLSGDLTRSITVLVVVCPCALVLATPTAVVAAIGNAAKRGMLVKSGGVIEQSGRVDAIAFDKTGTLTTGKPVVQEILPQGGMSPEELLALAASAERFSEHSLGRAIVHAAEQKHLTLSEPKDFTVLPGYGVTARIGERSVVVGNRALLTDKNLAWPDELDQRARALEEAGKTVVPVAVDGRVAGVLALADTPRLHAKATVAALKRLGVREIIMITGDNPRTAAAVAREVGIDKVFSEVLPQKKLEIIRGLQSSGRKVLFVGDGVNDAPAMAVADIGVAMGLAGTDVAMETASIGLMSDELERLPHVIDLSRKTLEVIRQNVIFSLAMNILSVVLGGYGIIGPVAGALMHEFSALPVLANAARLINYAGRLSGLKAGTAGHSPEEPV
ncbi:MAG: cation-translocating P-type ATPase [Elusimicrobia bacterium]|nr:cation-translocating P-type ATPase [Elusimicrobiota bacterium]